MLPPALDWVVPEVRDADPVCRVIAARAADRLRAAPSSAEAALDLTCDWSPRTDLTAQLAPGIGLDLREAATGGSGPHGVIVGATGAGKSELIRTLLLSLALTHPPERMQLLGIDFKGGAALDALALLPHCVGLVTNLEDDASLVERLRVALDYEIDRRQRLLRDGQSCGVALVLVIDEFSELLHRFPDMLEVLVRVGRLGRSLGLHLVLASQRLDEARIRELDSHLSWRLALRTFTATDSRAVLGCPDAVELPREPGWGLLSLGPGDLTRFRARALTDSQFTATVALIRDRASAEARPTPPPLWLAPLTTSPRVSELRPSALPNIPIGLSDHPVTRRVVELDLERGHVAIVGGPRSGKSTLLRAIAAELDRRDPARPVMLIDDWSLLRLEDPLAEDGLIRRALTDPDLRLVFAAHRWADVRLSLRDLLGTRIELRLADPLDSLLDRRQAAAIGTDTPGRGLILGPTGAEVFQAAVPDDFGVPSVTATATALLGSQGDL